MSRVVLRFSFLLDFWALPYGPGCSGLRSRSVCRRADRFALHIPNAGVPRPFRRHISILIVGQSPPPSKTTPASSRHLSCSLSRTNLSAHGLSMFALSYWRTAAARSPPPPQGNPRARRRIRFGLSLGLPRFPHRVRFAADLLRFPLGRASRIE